jgi:hypothetical protein
MHKVAFVLICLVHNVIHENIICTKMLSLMPSTAYDQTAVRTHTTKDNKPRKNQNKTKQPRLRVSTKAPRLTSFLYMPSLKTEFQGQSVRDGFNAWTKVVVQKVPSKLSSLL